MEQANDSCDTCHITPNRVVIRNLASAADKTPVNWRRRCGYLPERADLVTHVSQKFVTQNNVSRQSNFMHNRT